MRSAVVASSMLVLSLYCHRAEAGFPYGAYPQDGPNTAANGTRFPLAEATRRVSSAVRSAVPKPAAPPKYRAEPYRGEPYPGEQYRGYRGEQYRGEQYGGVQYRGEPHAGNQFYAEQHQGPVPRYPEPRRSHAPVPARPQYHVSQFDGSGPQFGTTPFPTQSPEEDTVPDAPEEEVQGGAILKDTEHSEHVHGPDCATSDCPGETVHRDDGKTDHTDHEPVYQTYEGGGCGYDPVPYYDSMAAPSWDYGQVAPTKACPTWFGGVYSLIMTRDGDEDGYLLGNSGDPSLLYLRSGDFDTGFSGGVEARIGRTFNCCRWGLEFVYWGLFPDNEQAIFDGTALANPMTTVLDYAYVYDAVGTPLSNYSDALVYARARRSEEYHNIEINFLSGPLKLSQACGPCADACGSPYSAVVGYDGGYGGGTYTGAGYPTYRADGCAAECGEGRCTANCNEGRCAADCGGCRSCGSKKFRRGRGDGYGPGFFGQGRGNVGCTEPRWIANWVCGVRFFKFNENVALDYSSVGPQINGATGELSHDFDAENNLVGVQLGLDLNYCLTKRLHLDLGSKFGLYGNHISSRQRIYTPDGTAYVLPSNPTDFNVNSSEDNVAFLGELRIGLGFKTGRHLRFTGGYRAIAASGVATALGQIDSGRELGALGKVADIDSDDSIVLHGAYVGSEFAW